MKKVFSTKDIAYSVKDMDMKQGIVQLYASTFDKLDDDGDIMLSLIHISEPTRPY